MRDAKEVHCLFLFISFFFFTIFYLFLFSFSLFFWFLATPSLSLNLMSSSMSWRLEDAINKNTSAASSHSTFSVPTTFHKPLTTTWSWKESNKLIKNWCSQSGSVVIPLSFNSILILNFFKWNTLSTYVRVRCKRQVMLSPSTPTEALNLIPVSFNSILFLFVFL